MAKEKKLTFLTLVADIFKEKLAEAGYRTIVKGFRGEESIRVHIQGSRKRHIIKIDKINCSGHTKYHIYLDSDRLRRSYKLWESGDFRIEDPLGL